ncbi:hypothetical protein RchiOBHm_Chr2g0169731 [Rosa chinensis]|uniref:Uncharacterized protein n=1 Tax=Rosa chinensis TaxID=74649 RepID=A0A2P6S4X3_ROSCH|nr:uncharacterized protein LOC112189776 [Rosa chinensis]PRQ53730.1 hypothetical protein RchiOBHm_Chr2g0169731 [Rosa chinensis]
MEHEPEKMAALKKAYADMILNTAKEAAARVMAAERKALRFEHDLRSTKDEALQMLVRLKQMIDSKTSEAQITSLKQERKIEELEAQLYEAEDIITDLRSELKQAWGKLERVNPNQVQPLNGQTTREDASFSGNVTPEPITISPSGLGHEDAPSSGLKNIPVIRGLDHKVCNGIEQTEQLSVCDLDKFYAPVSDFDSIIMRSKEPELLRNGCTQRVRAFERNSFDGKVPLSGYEDNQKSQSKKELIVKASDNGMEVVKKTSLGETKTPVKVRTIRRRKTQFGKDKTSHQYCPSQLMRSRQPSSVNGNDRSHEDVYIAPSINAEMEGIRRSSSGLEEKLRHSRCHPIDCKIIQKGKRKRKIQSKDGISTSFTSTGQPSPVLSRCRTFAYLINGDVKSCEDRPNTAENNEAKMKPLPRLDPGRTLIRSDVDPISGSTSVKVSIKGISKYGPGQNDADKGSELIGMPVLIKQGKDVVENSEAPSSEYSLGTDIVSGMNSEITDVKVSEQSSESPSHVDNSTLLKYTFQRKRKNSSSNPGETASFEENTSKRRAEERESIAPQPQMTNESSRDSRRLAQVARQLISLSGKRWYK